MISKQTFLAQQLSQPISVSAGSIITIAPVTAGSAGVLFSPDGVTYTAWDNGTISAASKDILKLSGYIKIQTNAGNWTLTINDFPSTADLAAYNDSWGIIGIKSYQSISELPPAATFGSGSVQVGNQILTSNGITWTGSGNVNTVIPLKVVTFGDSKSNVGSANTDLQFFNVPFSGAQSFNRAAAYKFLLDKYYENAWMAGNGGISGQTVQQMVQRSGLASSATRKAIEDLLALNPQVIIMKGGSINNLLGVTTATADAVVATDFALHSNLLQVLTQGGALVLDWGTEGYNNGSNTATDVAATRYALLKLNALIKADCATRTNVIYMDPLLNVRGHGSIGNPDGTWAAGMTGAADGTHNSVLAETLAAMQEADAIASFYGSSTNVRFKGANMISNATLMLPFNAGTGVFGPVATGFTLTGTNATVSNQAIEQVGSTFVQSCTVTPTVSGAGNLGVKFPFTPSTYGIVSGDSWGGEFDIIIKTLDGTPLNIKQLRGRIDIWQNTTNARIVYDDYAVDAAEVNAVFGSAFNNTIDVRCSMGPMIINDASANLNDASSSFTINLDLNGLSPVKVSFGNPRFCKLAKPESLT